MRGFVVVERAFGDPRDRRAEIGDPFRAGSQALPEGAWPALAELMPYWMALDVDQIFDYGLDRLLAGLDAELLARPAAEPRREARAPRRRPG